MIHFFGNVDSKVFALQTSDELSTETISKLTKGNSYFREKGVNHNVLNNNQFPYSFVEIEFK